MFSDLKLKNIISCIINYKLYSNSKSGFKTVFDFKLIIIYLFNESETILKSCKSKTDFKSKVNLSYF